MHVFEINILVALLLLVLSPIFAQSEVENVCGDCWCIHNPTGNNSSSSCPEIVSGIEWSFPESTAAAYASFVDTNPMELQADGGGDCYPFQEAIGPQPDYPGSNNPQCQKSSSDGFCAYLFEDTETTDCLAGRKYQAITYETEQAASDAGAYITHKGACGVCSSAQDLAVRMRTFNSLDTTSVLCGTRYFVAGRDFEELLSCYTELGFSDACAELWGHYTATNAALCAAPCLGSEPPFNGDPPECPLTECLQCSSDTFQPDFDLIGGRTLQSSGIVEEIARPCSNFYPVVHDPCSAAGGTTTTGLAPTMASPTLEPTTSTGSATSITGFKIGVIAIVGAIVVGL